MSSRNKIPFAAFLVALIGLSAGVVSATEPHVRDGWLVGLSFGYTQGNIKWGAGEDQGNYRGGATPQIRVGRMVHEHLALGVDYNGWMLEKGEVPLKIRSSLQSVSGTLTWYPGKGGKTPLAGFYLRGGLGYAWAGLTFVEIDEEPPEKVPLEQEHGTRIDESGIAINFQLGYEFRLSRTFATGLGVGYNHLAIGRDIYDSAYYFPITLTGAWYWD
jgi:hypothetical protein